jgi:hypothetical protein
MTVRAILLATATAALLGACGGSSEPPDVLKDFYVALAENDTKAACELLAKEQRVTDIIDGNCETALFLDPRPDVVNDIEAHKFEVTPAGENGTASVFMRDREVEYQFVREEAKWQLLAIGP